MDFGISLGTIALRFESVRHSAGWQITDQGTGCAWQRGSWHCTSDLYDAAEGRISAWLNPKSTSLSSTVWVGARICIWNSCHYANQEVKAEAQDKELTKAFPRSSQAVWLCAHPLLVFGNESCLKSVKLLFEGVTLVVMLCYSYLSVLVSGRDWLISCN